MNTVIHPTYFPNIQIFKNIVNSKNLFFEINDNYVKQTFRNRTSIYTANGKLDMTIPVKFSSSKKEKLKDIKICDNSNWQNIHIKSIQTAYNNSPYFDFFEEYFIDFFKKKYKFLIDVNINSIKIIFEILEKELDYNFTEVYIREYIDSIDLRNLSNKPKLKTKVDFKKYNQVFDEDHGFIKNLSSIDLIFNKGLNSVDFINN